jgi:cell pole-organizing protein PopZ
MEDILASIRKILSEDEAEPAKPAAPEPPKAAAPPPPPPPPEEREPAPVFTAEPEPEPEPEPQPEPPPPMPEPEPEPEAPLESLFDADPEPEPVYDPNLNIEPEQPLQLTDEMLQHEQPQYYQEPPMSYQPPQEYGAPYGQGLVANNVEQASSASIASLTQAVARERALALGNHGLTLEQLVREICTPLLKEWLDTNLPYMVERVVKQEIERIVNRSERM